MIIYLKVINYQNFPLNNVQLIEGDICDERLVNKISRGCKYIYHFAAVLGVEVVSENHKKTMDIETIGMKNIVDAAIKNNNLKKLSMPLRAEYMENLF